METVQLHQAEAGLQCGLMLLPHRQVGWSTGFVSRDRLSHIVKQDREVIGSTDQHALMVEMQVECLASLQEKCLEDRQEYVYSESELGMLMMSLSDQVAASVLV